MKTLKIDRTKWSRGKTINTSINEAGFPRTWLWDKQVNAGCCLGHYCIQIAGFNEEDLNTYGEPREYAHVINKPIEGLVDEEDSEDDEGGTYLIYVDNEFASAAMELNDEATISDEEREASLITLFAKNDIELSFYN